ncbi:PRC-barrel domain-containing protein [Sandarakinorhabdus sp. DWP1-3-1]|uniref:PRC-barrel domain-containing protein n=1 Tax=Sandarakinorhabdus sp. DWP1-3-1 TaxID=2804627 RepID=UPI003CE88853
MADVVDASHRTLSPASLLCTTNVLGRDGEKLGTIVELMIAAGEGRIDYAALAIGGRFGIGERLYAVPWACFVIDPVAGSVALPVLAADFEGLSGFDKDAWPAVPDAELTMRLNEAARPAEAAAALREA